MRVIQRVFASLRYHWRYALLFGTLAVLFLVSGLSTLIVQDIQSHALSLFEQRMDIIDRTTKTLTRWPILRKLLHVRQGIVSDTQLLYNCLFGGFIVLVLVLIILTLIQRKHEFSIYQLAGKGTADISLQFALENLILFMIAFFGITILLLAIQGWYLNGLVEINQTWFTEKLPADLKKLATTGTSQPWQNFNQLFQHQFTTFNGHLLLFDQGSRNPNGLADYDRNLWTIFWQGGGMIFLTSYLSASFYNWHISRQARATIK
ncbi:FtsX-like permease family protein [Loigolactobacillus jiayinensis]|mgnify:CR=1 FL=1|uniref:FtsX-like permease family protein n=1 Tax=Loigolactobacillus jiayinensis TaxID=2486016 RepID=A0ABW1RFE2_9LACO|nr:FtsX-like permease family protein [Loigolactobacillus jiayinensis]